MREVLGEVVGKPRGRSFQKPKERTFQDGKDMSNRDCAGRGQEWQGWRVCPGPAPNSLSRWRWSDGRRA